MPTIREVFERVRKTDDNKSDPDYEHLADALGIQYYFNAWGNEDFSRLVGYWVSLHCCSGDTWVGQRAYFFDGEPVAMSIQHARKATEQFWFVSQEAAQKVRAFLYEIIMKETEREVSIVSPDVRIEPTYSVHFAGEFIDRKGTYEGRPCVVLHKPYSIAATECDIQFEDGSVKTVKAEDVKLPLRLA